MSSLKALAAAKSRRSGGEQNNTSGIRPGTSIASHSAFAGQYQQRGGPQQRQQPQRQQPQQQQQQEPQIQSNGLPFSKLTVSDAIGLITLRLGKVEQYLIDVQNDGGFGNQSDQTLPNNTKLIDTSVLTSIVNRLDSLEKREPTSGPGISNSTQIQIQNQIGELLTKVDSLSKLERELKDTKEMLVNLMFKFEIFTKETNTKFIDHENIILELGQQIQTPVEPLDENIVNMDTMDTTELESSIVLTDDPDTEKILSAELKNMIKQELSIESE